MKRKFFVAGLVGLCGLSGIIVHALLWGKLFAISPVTPNFDRHRLASADIYVEEGNDFHNNGSVDPLMRRAEMFLGLRFKRRPLIFFFGKQQTYADRAPCSARACTVYGGAIMVSPRAQKQVAGPQTLPDVYLTHELSHLLMHQHMGLLAVLRYPDWLVEGIAMVAANQMGTAKYPSRQETHALIKQGNWMPPTVFRTDQEARVSLHVPNRATFAYSQFACIVEDLIERFGRQTFLRYVHRLFSESDCIEVFHSTFGVDFAGYLRRLRRRIAQPPSAI